MKKRPVPYAIFGAVFCGLVGIVSFYVYVQDQQAQARAHDEALSQQFKDEMEDRLKKERDSYRPVTLTATSDQVTHRVLYAKQDIDAGIPLSADMFYSMDTPGDILKQAFTVNESEIVRRSYSLRPIQEGEPLSETNVGIDAPRLADRIPNGFKAMTIPALSGAGNLTGGFLQDGDTVDLLLTHPQDPADPKSPVACDAVIQALPVLYVPGADRHGEKLEGVAPSSGLGAPVAVTVQVTLQEAQILTLLQSIPASQFQMILRSRSDNGISKNHTFTQDGITDNLSGLQNKVDKTVLQAEGLHVKALQDKGAKVAAPTEEMPAQKR